MADVIYKKGQSANLDNVEIADGQILVTEDTGEMYIDMSDGTRKKVTDTNKPGLKTAEGGEIFNDYENNQARTPMSSARGESTVAGGKGFKIIGIQKYYDYANKNKCPVPEDRFIDRPNHIYEFTIKQSVGGKFDIICPHTEVETLTSVGLAAGTYTFSTSPNISKIVGLSVPGFIPPDGGNPYITDGQSFTLTERDSVVVFVTGDTPYNGCEDCYLQIEEGTTKTDFECPYEVIGYTLDSVTDIKENDIFSVRIGNNYDNQGIITSIDPYSFTVAGTNLVEGTTTDLTNAYLWLPVMPEDWSTYDDPDTKTSLKATRKINAGTTYMDATQYAEGTETYAINYAAHAEGKRSVAAGRWSHAEGKGTYAVYGAHSEGLGTKAIGQGSHSEGERSMAKGYYSHSEGCITNALGGSSHSEGYETTAQGEFSHAEGLSTISIGEGSHAEGFKCKATGDNSHAEGNQTESSGKYSHAEGLKTKAIGDYSHSTGIDTTAEKSGAFAGGTGSHALGNNSFAFGSGAYARGDGAIAMGYGAQAQTFMNVAMGKNAIASGGRSISLGEYVTTSSNNQFAVGIYNRPEAAAGHKLPVFMVGYGTSESDRKNVFEVDRNGVATVGADPIDNMDVATKQYVDNSISSLNPTVDLSGYMPLTGGTITSEEAGWAISTINQSLFKIDYQLTGFNSFIQMGANKEIGEDATHTPKYSGYITLANTECSNAIEGIEIPSGTFEITAIGVKGNDTAKTSWQNWLEINTLKTQIAKLQSTITQLQAEVTALKEQNN